MQKLERLLNLTAVLLHSGYPLTAQDLRERVPGYPDSDVAFRRSFERDKDDLREMGIPLELVEITGADPPADGYIIPRGRYYLPDPGLEPDELAALQLAVAAVRLDGVSGAEAMWKLGGAAADAAHDAAPIASLPSDPNLGPLLDAVSSRSVVQFVYRDERREVHPYRLGFQRGHWYLRGHDLVRGERRTYRVDRIDGPVDVGPSGRFEIPEDEAGDGEVLPDGWQIGHEPSVTARVSIDASHAPIALAQFAEDDVVERRPDGSIVVAVEVTNRAALRSLVLSYLDHAELLEPVEMRDELVTWLRSVPGVDVGSVP
ncbi:MAG: helix-turn-helix transcriptional regulator [Acidimicrobiales bacterium]